MCGNPPHPGLDPGSLAAFNSLSGGKDRASGSASILAPRTAGTGSGGTDPAAAEPLPEAGLPRLLGASAPSPQVLRSGGVYTQTLLESRFSVDPFWRCDSGTRNPPASGQSGPPSRAVQKRRRSATGRLPTKLFI